MKKFLIVAGVSLALTGAFSSCEKKGEPTRMEKMNDSVTEAYGDMVGKIVLDDFNRNSEKDSVITKEGVIQGMKMVFKANPDKSTLLGMQFATQILSEVEYMEEQGLTIDRAQLLKVIIREIEKDSVDRSTLVIASHDFNSLLDEAIAVAQEEKGDTILNNNDISVQNAQAAEMFMEMVRQQSPDVQTSPSGLSYIIEEVGSGEHPTENSVVKVNYTGRHLDGSVFDSNAGIGEPATFPLTGVVPGFSEGLKLLGKGGKATLFIPGNLAYGQQGYPPVIGPNEMLVFEIELVDFN